MPYRAFLWTPSQHQTKSYCTLKHTIFAEDNIIHTSISDSLYKATSDVIEDMECEMTASDVVLQSFHMTIQDGFPANCSQLEPQIHPEHRSASNSIDDVIIRVRM